MNMDMKMEMKMKMKMEMPASQTMPGNELEIIRIPLPFRPFGMFLLQERTPADRVRRRHALRLQRSVLSR